MGFLTKTGELLAHAHGIYLFLAVIGSVFFLFQLVMTLAGGGLDHDCGDDSFEIQDHGTFDLNGLKLLSVKGIISFVTFFGWAGFFWGSRGWAGFLLALLCGFLMMFLTALALWMLLKLQQSGTFHDRDCIGCSATVYLPVPEGRRPGGQVTITLPGGTRQSRAVADTALARGMAVTIQAVIGPDLFLVVPIEDSQQKG